MSRDEFIRKWKCHLAGLALYGIAFEAKEGPLARAGRALEVPAEVERLLRLIYADLATAEDRPAVPRAFADARANGPAKNGH